MHVELVGPVTLVRFTIPEVMHADVIDFVGDRLFSLVEDEGRRLIVLDFSAVRKLSSALLGRLVGLHKRLLALEGRLALCGIDAEVRQVFDLCQLPRLLHLYADQGAALAALSRDADASGHPAP
jgi:anti-sigma B factor antagonist